MNSGKIEQSILSGNNFKCLRKKERKITTKKMELPKGAKITHSGLLQHNTDGTTDLQKITQAGLVARSPEGTAAKGMNIRGNEDLWVEIQANTFRNWVNEHLRDVGLQVSSFDFIF